MRRKSEQSAGLAHLPREVGTERELARLARDALGLVEFPALQVDEPPGEGGPDAIDDARRRGRGGRERTLVEADGRRFRPHPELDPQSLAQALEAPDRLRAVPGVERRLHEGALGNLVRRIERHQPLPVLGRAEELRVPILEPLAGRVEPFGVAVVRQELAAVQIGGPLASPGIALAQCRSRRCLERLDVDGQTIVRTQRDDVRRLEEPVLAE